MADSSKEPGVTRAPFELALETQRLQCFVSCLVLAPRLVKGLLGINFNPKMFGCCLLIAFCAPVGLVGLVCAAKNGSEAWEFAQAEHKKTAQDIGMKPSLVRM